MPDRSSAEIIEVFHLSFLLVLGRKVEPRRYVLKGGANLRYFFGSERYSEDIDLDLAGEEPWQLRRKVDALFDSPALRLTLRSTGVEVAEVTTHKQTETTQRWKLGLKAPGHSQLIRTKVEFSNRNGEERIVLERVPNNVADRYALRSPSVQHYQGEAAAEQKVDALASRSQVQTRDVFDLDLLLRSYSIVPGQLDAELLEKAATRALELEYQAFRDQVLPFLEPAIADQYDEEAWDQMRMSVADKLEVAK